MKEYMANQCMKNIIFIKLNNNLKTTKLNQH
jgi:hypothetical protein